MAADVTVTQADTDAAKAFWNAYIAGWKEQSERQRALVQAFARHAKAAREEALREAAEVALSPGFIEARDTEWDQGVNDAKRIISRAILALARGEA